MTQESGEPKQLTREELLAKLKEDGINTLEDLVDEVIPEVGGFLLRSGGMLTTTSSGISSTGTDAATFVGSWYAYSWPL